MNADQKPQDPNEKRRRTEIIRLVLSTISATATLIRVLTDW